MFEYNKNLVADNVREVYLSNNEVKILQSLLSATVLYLEVTVKFSKLLIEPRESDKKSKTFILEQCHDYVPRSSL